MFFKLGRPQTVHYRMGSLILNWFYFSVRLHFRLDNAEAEGGSLRYWRWRHRKWNDTTTTDDAWRKISVSGKAVSRNWRSQNFICYMPTYFEVNLSATDFCKIRFFIATDFVRSAGRTPFWNFGAPLCSIVHFSRPFSFRTKSFIFLHFWIDRTTEHLNSNLFWWDAKTRARYLDSGSSPICERHFG